MRVLQVHNIYQQVGGEDVVVAAEGALLRERGQEVHLHTVSNDAIKGTWRKIQTAWRAAYSAKGRAWLAEEIKRFSPNVVHVHNFFPLLTPAVYDACRDAGVPVVQTLHNYRIICPQGMLMRNGRPCEDCLSGSPYQAVLHGCYQGSRSGSLAVARMVDVHRKKRTWHTKVDRFIALTDFAKEVFAKAGIPPDRIAVKPNFVEDRGTSGAVAPPRNGALFVGRLSPEKGIRTMLEAWSALDVPLRVAGDGPLLDVVRKTDAREAVSLGSKPPEDVANEMSSAEFLIMPSEMYETFGLVIVEAFCHALPVIASRLGAMAEIVEDGVTGLHFTPGDAEDLAAKVRRAAAHPDEMRRMGLNARRAYEKKYTPEANYPQLMAIYQEAIEENRRHRD